ncbi:nSTAND1 domain-containing NTPase [Nonomuraea wenchangensis]
MAPTLPVTLGYAVACGGDRSEWAARWHLLMRELEGDVPPPAEEVAPYRGLVVFQPEHARWYFGRERLVRELCDRLSGTPFLAVMGTSGSGKSSLLRAGLLPALRQGITADGAEWPAVVMVPGEHPLRALAAHLGEDDLGEDDPPRAAARFVAGRPAGARLVVIVDQFEEVFTLCRDEGERAAFVSALLALAREPRTHVVAGMRADFYARCAELPGLASVLQDNQLIVGPMEEEDLRRVVTGPAGRAGLTVDAELVELVVNEAQGQPGALSLVSHALLETWRRRTGPALTVAAYLAAGGVRGAIAQTAEHVYGELDAQGREIVRQMFLRLTVPGDGTEDTRRRAPRDELLDGAGALPGRRGGPDGDAVAAVLDKVIAARLVIVDESCVTIAHEALIRGWPRLRSWLEEDREALRAHRRLTEAVAEWEEHGRDDAFLFSGSRLAVWEGDRTDRLNSLEREFLEASGRREAAVRRAGRRRVRLALTGLTAAVVAMTVLACLAVGQAHEATEQRDIALSRQIAAEARNQLHLDPKQALRLAKQAYALWPTAEAEGVLRQGIADDHLLDTLPGLGRALGVAFSPDDARLAVTSADGLVRVWSWSDGGVSPDPPAVLRGHQGEVWSPVFSPDGRRLATAGLDGTVRVWDLERPEATVKLTGHTGAVWNVAFSPDGRAVAGAGDDGTVRIWNLGDGGGHRVLRGPEGAVIGVAFSPDGRRLAAGGEDGTVRIWDLAGPDAPLLLRGHGGVVKNVGFSPDGRRLASTSTDGAARVWRLDQRESPPLVFRHEGTAEGMAFSRDGHWLATTGDDSTVRLWSPDGGGDPLVLRGHQRVVWEASFSADGRRLATAGEDGTVRVWDPRGTGDPVVLRGHDGAALAVGFSPDGRVVTGGVDRTVRIWEPATGAHRALRGHTDEVMGLAVSRDGRRVAGASRDGTVRIWEVDGAGDPRILRGHDGVVWSASFSPDGRRVAGAGADGTLRIWDTADPGRPPLLFRADARQIRFAAFSPDGRHVATGGQDGTVRIWDATGATAPRILRGHEGLVWAVAFSPDGRRVASAGTDGTVRIWSTTGGGESLVQRGSPNMVWYVAFSPDGRWVAGAGKDGTVRIWRSDTASPPIVIGGFAATVEAVEFSRDGRLLATAHGDGTVRVRRCDVCEPVPALLAQVDDRLAGMAD